jgi:CRISPR-associated protein Cmr5
MPETSPRTREQVRAAAAHALISEIKGGSEKSAKEFGRQCLRLPSLIHQCGLCQALAFLEAKKFGPVVHGLARVVSAPEDDAKKRLDGPALAKQAREAGMIEYQWLSREALKSAQWLKRYTEAILNLKPGDADEASNTGGGQ